jgi:hypothetical protein
MPNGCFIYISLVSLLFAIIIFSTEIRSSFCIDAIPAFSSKLKGTAESVGENLYGIKRVVGKTVMRFLNPSGIDDYGNNPALLFVFEGENVCVLWLNELKSLRQLNHPNVIKPYFNISRYYFNR